MKTRSFMAVAVLAGIGLLVIGLEYSLAAKDKIPASPKIGIVSVKDVFDKSPMKADVEKELSADADKKFAELKKLEETLEADKAALSKRKEGSEDYMQLLQTVLQEQSKLDAQKEFYQQELSMKEMQSKEKLYRKILEAIATVAKEKGLDIILSRDDNYLNQPDTNPPAQSPSDLLLTTKTHKLLYFNPGLDVTADVVTAMAKSAQ